MSVRSMYTIYGSRVYSGEDFQNFFANLYEEEIHLFDQIKDIDVFSLDVAKAIKKVGEEYTSGILRHDAGKVIFAQIIKALASENTVFDDISFTVFGRSLTNLPMENDIWSRYHFILMTFRDKKTNKYGSVIFDAWTKFGININANSTKTTEISKIFHDLFGYAIQKNSKITESKSMVIMTKTIMANRNIKHTPQVFLKPNPNSMNYFLVNDATSVEVKIPKSDIWVKLEFNENRRLSGITYMSNKDGFPLYVTSAPALNGKKIPTALPAYAETVPLEANFNGNSAEMHFNGNYPVNVHFGIVNNAMGFIPPDYGTTKIVNDAMGIAPPVYGATKKYQDLDDFFA